MRCFLIMNPGSRSGRSARNFEKIFDILKEKAVQYDYEVTRSLSEAYTLSRKANEEGYEAIIAVGGDGTINQVLNGFYNDEGKRISSSKFGVIYTGTSPDFCKSYGIPLNIEEAASLIIRNSSRRIQVGRITMAKAFNESLDSIPENSTEDFVTRYFACCVNIGLGAELARRANSGIRGIVGDELGTFTALIRTLISYKPMKFNVLVDGRHEQLEEVYNLSVGKTHFIASGIKVKNSLVCGDHRFYRLTVKGLKLGKLPGVMRAIYSGRQIISNSNISLDYCRAIEVTGPENTRIEFDGDPAGFLPCRITMAPDPIDLICEGGYE